MLSREERILSELLVSRGVVSRERIESCAQGRGAATAQVSLVDALVDSGEVERDTAQEAAAEARSLAEALTPELPAGHVLGEFRLLREIGRGGMGIVYEAEQTSLSRRVALKILPAGAALDERLSLRFVREARAVGRLIHPGIVPVYTSGRTEGVLYYAMELIDGRSVAQVLAAGPLEPAAAARIAIEVARALDYAHGEGLVHRDVKPENILLCSDGRARIVDFGLVHDIAAGSFTLSRHVLGTPAFTAPEQARGETVGPASDVYGVGAVLYAMLAGTPPYEGDTPPLVLARVLTEPPPPLAAPGRDVPPALAAIAERAMARDPACRHPTAAALADALEGYLRGEIPALPVDAPPPEVPREVPHLPNRTRNRWVMGLGAAAVTALALALVVSPRQAPSGALASAPADEGSARFRLIPGTRERKVSPALSPDGKQVAYASAVDGDMDIYLLDVAGGTPVNLTPDSTAEDLEPAFSPDGRTIAFASARATDREIRIVDLASLQTRSVVHTAASNLVWSPDGRSILFADRPYNRPGNSSTASKLWSVDLDSGRASALTAMYAVQPAVSASASRIAFVSQGGGQTDLWTVGPQGDGAVKVTDDAAIEWSPVWTPDGAALLFGSDRDGTPGLWRVAVDRATGAAAGPAVRLSSRSLGAPFYLSAAAVPGAPLLLSSVGQPAQLHRLTLEGSSGTVGIAALGERFLAVESAGLSPDGAQLAFTAVGGDEDLVVSAADGSEPRLLTRDPYHDRAPRWAPDGRTIAFQSDRGGNREIWTIETGGEGLTQRTRTAGDAGIPVWSPDGTRIAYTAAGLGACTVALEAGGTAPADPQPLPGLEGQSFEPWSWSGDGRALAGMASGIAIYTFAERSLRKLTESGRSPVWLSDGRQLLYIDGREIRVLDVRTGESRALFDAAPAGLSPHLGASPDGRTIYASLTADDGELWRVELTD